MPRNVRNFWIDAEADGRATRAGLGPAARDGGARVRVRIRDGGAVAEGITLECDARDGGALELRAYGPDGGRLATVHAHRDAPGLRVDRAPGPGAGELRERLAELLARETAVLDPADAGELARVLAAELEAGGVAELGRLRLAAARALETLDAWAEGHATTFEYLRALPGRAAGELREALEGAPVELATAEELERARAAYASEELAIDAGAAASRAHGPDGGVWVAAWVWLADPEGA